MEPRGMAASTRPQYAPRRVGGSVADRASYRRGFDFDARDGGRRPAAGLRLIGPLELLRRPLAAVGERAPMRPARLSLSRCGWRSCPSAAATGNRKARASVLAGVRVWRTFAQVWFPTRSPRRRK